MARISYVNPASLSDALLRAWLKEAVETGRPGPENQAIRAHQPDVLRSFTLTRKLLFDAGAGILEHGLKELTRAYIAYTVDCGY